MSETKAERRLRLARAEERAAFNALPKCKAVIWTGAGHQSDHKCIRRGPHKQHESDHGMYWSKMEDYSGFFNESPEEPE